MPDPYQWLRAYFPRSGSKQSQISRGSAYSHVPLIPDGRASKGLRASSTFRFHYVRGLCSRRDPHTLRDRTAGTTKYELSRGGVAFPSLGDSFLCNTTEQIGGHCEEQKTATGEFASVGHPYRRTPRAWWTPTNCWRIWQSWKQVAAGRKSFCTVAGLIRWVDGRQRKWALKDIREEEQAGRMRLYRLGSNGERIRSRVYSDRGVSFDYSGVPTVVGPGRGRSIVPVGGGAAMNGLPWHTTQPGLPNVVAQQRSAELKSGQMEGVPREALIGDTLFSDSTRI